MLTQPTLEKLCAMRLRGMAGAFREQQQDADVQRLSFEERLGLLIDRQWNWRENRALDRRLRNARLQGLACVEDIDYRAARGLDRQMVRSLTTDVAPICFATLLRPDWVMAPLSDAARRDFLEICDDRYQNRAMLLIHQTSQIKGLSLFFQAWKPSTWRSNSGQTDCSYWTSFWRSVWHT